MLPLDSFSVGSFLGCLLFGSASLPILLPESRSYLSPFFSSWVPRSIPWFTLQQILIFERNLSNCYAGVTGRKFSQPRAGQERSSKQLQNWMDSVRKYIRTFRISIVFQNVEFDTGFNTKTYLRLDESWYQTFGRNERGQYPEDIVNYTQRS